MFLYAPRSNVLDVVGSFNKDSIGRHGGSIDEESALALFNKHSETVTKAIEDLRLFREFPLMGTTNNGREISLSGVASVPEELRDDSAALYTDSTKYLPLWPFILIDSSSHTVALNLNDISNIEDANRRTTYVGAMTKEKREFATSDEDKLAIRIVAALKDKLGPLVEGQRRVVLDSFGDYEEAIRDFSGREWLFKGVKTFIESRGQSLFLIVGQPGVGKSAFMKKFPDLAKQYDPKGQLLSVSSQFFITHNNTMRNTVFACLRHIEQELQQGATVKLRSNRDEEPQSEPQKSVHRLQLLFDQICRADADYWEKPIPIFIDGVDELKPEEIKQFVEAVNSLRGIPNIRLVITSRDIAELENLQKPDRRLQLERDACHRADLFNFARCRLGRLGWNDESVKELIEKTDGYFLFLVMVIRDVQLGLLTKENLGSLPRGLEAYYKSILDLRMKDRFNHEGIGWRTVGFTILKLICVARTPLNREQLSNFCGREIAQIRQALELMQELLKQGGEHDGYRLFHLSLQEFIRTEYGDELKEANRLIIRYYEAIIDKGEYGRLDAYFFCHIQHHIEEAEEWEFLDKILLDTEVYRYQCYWTPREPEDLLALDDGTRIVFKGFLDY